jgi:hypothetical protein
MGKIWVSGRAANYATGRNNTTNLSSLTQIGSDTDWSDVGGQSSGGAAVKNGELYTWGRNLAFWTGAGTSSGNTQVPTKRGSLTNWTYVDRQCAIAGGELYTWGSNGSGVTGQGTTSGDTQTPTKVGSKTDWVKVLGNIRDTSSMLGLDSAGRIWSWGSNANYTTGQGTNTGNITTPTQIGSDTDWVEIGIFGAGGFAIKSDGTLWSWGSAGTENLTRQGASTTTSSPTQVGSDTDWQRITGQSTNVLAIKNGGRLYAWGSNANYLTGQGTNTGSTSSITQIGSATGWTHIEIGSQAAFGIKAGELFSWGSNIDGVTAQGTSSGSTTTVTQVGSSNKWSHIYCNDFTLFMIEATTVIPDITSVSHSGTEASGSTLTASYTETGGVPSPTITYQWEENNGSWSDISGATSSTFVLTSAQVGKTVRVKVTATNTAGADSGYSTASSTITGAPVIASVSISGTADVGNTLTASASVTGHPTPTNAWQWHNTDGAISGATSSTYTVQNSDRAKQIRVQLTSTNSEGSDSEYSSYTSFVPRAPDITAASISGTEVKGNVLTANYTETAGVPTPTMTYQWQRDSSGWANLSGETASTYTLISGDVGKKVRVIVTATNSAGSDSFTTNETAFIGEIPVITTLTISGTEELGETLSSTFFADGYPAPSLDYQWQRYSGSWGDISGAVSANYTLTVADVGKEIRIKGTATNTHGSDVGYSSPTGEIKREPQINSVTITGTAQTGVTLTSSYDIDGHPTPSRAYQWQSYNSIDGWTDLVGETSSSFLITDDEIGLRLRLELTATNSEGSATAYSIRTEKVVPAPVAPTISKPIVSGITQSGQTLTGDATDSTGYPPAVFTYQWQRYVSGSWTNISGAVNKNYIVKKADIGFSLRVKITATNASGSDFDYSDGTAEITEAVGTDLYRVYLHDWDGEALGELTDVKNLSPIFGISKNCSLSFDTTLNSPMGLELADNPYLFVSVYRWNPYTDSWFLTFSGVKLTTEEKGSDSVPTVGATFVGGYWRLSKRIADDSSGSGRRQSGLAPATSEIYAIMADRVGNRVLRYNTTGAFMDSFGSSGTGDGQFDAPRGVAVGPGGFIYVVDTGNNRVQKFTDEGVFVAKWGTTGSGNTNFNNPRDVTVDDSGNVWVTDKGNERVIKFDSDGNFILKVEASGSYTMNELEGIFAHTDGTIYAADAETGGGDKGFYKISSQGQILSSSTGSMLKFVRSGDGQNFWTNVSGNTIKSGRNGAKNSTINNSGDCKSVQVGSDGSVYVLEDNGSSISRVRKYSANGTLSRTFGAWGSGTGQSRGVVGFDLLRAGARDGIEIAEELINYNNSSEGNNWVRPADTLGESAKVFIKPGSLGGYKKIAEVIENLANGFEWVVTPKMYTDGDGIVLSEFYADETVGENKSSLISFQYGVGQHNLDSYTIKETIESITTRTSYPAADAKPYAITAEDSEAVDELGIFEETADGALIDNELRRKLLNIYLRFNKIPRTLISITPSRSDQTGPLNTRVPIPLIDYQVGDFVGVNIQDEGRSRLTNAEARIYDISITIDESGREQAEIDLYIE